MQYTLYIILAIVLFGVLIAVHEFGHFITAKLLGVKVNEFSIGMGPLLLHKSGKETEYSLRLFPIGGFCAMEGEDISTDDPRSFERQAAWRKFIILVAGSAMNFVAGVLIIFVLFTQAKGFYTPTITGFMDGAEHLVESGLQEGDRFYRIDGHRIYFMNDVSLFFGRTDDHFIDVEVVRDGQHIVLENFDFTPRVPMTDEQGQTTYLRGFYYGATEPATMGVILKNTWYQAIDFVRMVWLGLGDLITGAAGLRDLSGPIGIVDAVGDVGASAPSTIEGLFSVFNFMALIAINLAVMNLLPIPALDGGRIFFLIVGKIFRLLSGKKLDPKYESWVNAAGFVLLMVLMVVIAISDVMKLISL